MQLVSDIPTKHEYGSSLTAPNGHIPVSPRGDEPRLSRNPFDLQNTQTFLNLMSTEDLQRNNQWVCHEIVVYPRMEHLNRAIIR